MKMTSSTRRAYDAVHKSNCRGALPRHRRDACSIAWPCRFITARRSQNGRIVAVHPTHWLIYAQVMTPVSKVETAAWADPMLKLISQGDVIQFERRGFYRVDLRRNQILAARL